MIKPRLAPKFALYMVTFVSHLGWTVLAPVLPLLQAEFGIGAAMVALVSSVYGLSRLATALPAGLLGDRIGHRRLLVVGCTGLVLGSIAGALSATFVGLLVSRLVSGFGACLMVVTNMVLMSQLSEPQHRGRDLGIYAAFTQAGSAFSPVLAGLIASWGGWRAPLWLSAGTAAATLLIVLLTPGLGSRRTEAVAEPKQPKHRGAGGYHLPSVVSAQAVTFVLFFAGTTFTSTFLPLFGAQKLGLDVAVLGLILGVGTSLRFVVSIGGGFLSDRFGRKWVIVPGLLLGAAGMTLVVVWQGIVGFLLGTALLSLGRLGNGVPNTVLADHLPPHRWGAAMGLNRFLGDLGLVIGPLLLGLIMDRAGMGPAGYVFAAAALTVALTGLMIKDPRRGPDQAAAG